MWTQHQIYWAVLGVNLPLDDQNNNILEVATQKKNNRTKE
jgi:hypothetical protein